MSSSSPEHIAQQLASAVPSQDDQHRGARTISRRGQTDREGLPSAVDPAVLEKVGAREVAMHYSGGQKKLALHLSDDIVYNIQPDGSVALWKHEQGKASAVVVPADAAKDWTAGIYGGRYDRTPSTDANVQGKRTPTTVEALATNPPQGFSFEDHHDGTYKLLLQDNISFWIAKNGDLCLQSRVGPLGLAHGNPDNPIYTLPPSEKAKITDLTGCGWYWTMSAPGHADSIFNPHDQFGAFGKYDLDANGNAISANPLMT